MPLQSFLLLFGGGIVAGTIGAMLGLGGGVFLVPFLVLVLGVPMHQAIATSIVAVIATSSAGAAINVERRTVNIKLGMLLETTTVLGAIAGGFTGSRLSGASLEKIFAALLTGVSFLMIYRVWRQKSEEVIETDGLIPASYFDESKGTTVTYAVRRLPGTMAISLLAGNVSGLLGIGGGIFKVPAMHLISGIPMKAATATSNFMIGVTAAASAFVYFAHGHLDPLVASSAALGVLLGSFFGVLLSRTVKAKVLNWIFAAVLLFTAIQLSLR